MPNLSADILSEIPSGELPSHDEIVTLVLELFAGDAQGAIPVYLRVFEPEAKGMPEQQAARFGLLILKIMELIGRHLHSPQDLELLNQELRSSHAFQEYTRMYELSEAKLSEYVRTLALGIMLLAISGEQTKEKGTDARTED